MEYAVKIINGSHEFLKKNKHNSKRRISAILFQSGGGGVVRDVQSTESD